MNDPARHSSMLNGFAGDHAIAVHNADDCDTPSHLKKARAAEQAMYDHALSQGHKPLSAPHNPSAQGPDLVTYDSAADEIVVWDAKYRTTGSFPKSIPPEDLARWQPYVDAAIRNYDGVTWTLSSKLQLMVEL